ncbi:MULTISPECIES: polysaccharide biosynthesis C-terminal domain-containing protein [Dorea]
MALPCILFPSAVTNAVSSMLLPTVAGLQEMKDRQQLRSLILKITCSCILLGCFCCGVLLILGKWIGIFLFKSPLAGNFILTLAWICPFLYTNTVLLSMINGLGKTTCSFLFNLFSLCIRITGVFLFIPAAGISGYLNGLLISQIFLFLCCILRLSVYAGKY